MKAKHECDLVQYIKNLDTEISRINLKNDRIEKQQNRTLEKCKSLLEKKELSSKEIEYLNNAIFYTSNNIFDIIPNIFSMVVDKILEGYDKYKCVDEKLLKLLENIIAKEDFSLFASDLNENAFERLYSLVSLENITLTAILNYLTDEKKMISMLSRVIELKELKSIRRRLDQFCGFLIKNNVDLSIPKKRIYESRITRQIV